MSPRVLCESNSSFSVAGCAVSGAANPQDCPDVVVERAA